MTISRIAGALGRLHDEKSFTLDGQVGGVLRLPKRTLLEYRHRRGGPAQIGLLLGQHLLEEAVPFESRGIHIGQVVGDDLLLLHAGGHGRGRVHDLSNHNCLLFYPRS